MKKIILLLTLYCMTAPSFSQNIIFQDNFEKGRMNTGWKILHGSWSVTNLESKSILPTPGGNNFALTGTGYSEINIDIPVTNSNQSVTVPLNFNYWVHAKDSKGTVTIVCLQANGDSINSVHFPDLTAKNGWNLFNEVFKIPAQTATIRLKLGEKDGPTRGNIIIYYQNICIGCEKRR